MISRGTIKIYPSSVEKFLLGHDSVSKACVVGVLDKRLNQQVCAIVVPKPGASLTEKILKAYADDNLCTDEGLGYKPGYYIIVDELPIVNGKVNRGDMEKMAIKKLKLSQ